MARRLVLVGILVASLPVILYLGITLYLDLTQDPDPERVLLQAVHNVLDYAWDNPGKPPPDGYRDLQVDRCWEFIQRSSIESHNQYTTHVTYNSDDETYFRDTSEVNIRINFADGQWVAIRFYEYGPAGCSYGIANDTLQPEDW